MRIKDKTEEIEIFLEELISFLPAGFDEYKTSSMVKSACERHFEKIIEAIVDLAFLIVKEKGLKNPEDDKSVFNILKDNQIISEKLSERLKNAKGMRNILAHEYGSIDDETVFHALTEELEDDVKEFIKEIKKLMK
ncbi:MAG: DUF86 domain-containing protein [Nanoarchaeota archaeon]|nr:DUF86 domain-containing protein [Nanoarchaeota archaeon]MBU1623325.1 DUF86 domain-containing protein [Nanoarchaeota archaeon]